jgi:hypothetical protein
MTRFLVAFTAFLFGCGLIAILLTLLWGRLGWQTGVIGMAGLWVVAFTLAVFLDKGR